MNELEGATEIRQLCQDYFEQRISLDEYRQRRKLFLDRIDEELNGVRNIDIEESPQSSLLGKAFAFIKGETIKGS